jgi:hypothetical protein
VAFNLTSWSRKGRDFGRGTPPPVGSVEWAGVGGPLFYGPRAPSPPDPAPTAAPTGGRSALPKVAAFAALAGVASLAVAGLASRFSRERDPEPGGGDLDDDLAGNDVDEDDEE